MDYIDTHVHLYSKEFKNDLAKVINDALSNGVNRMLMPNVDVDSMAPMKQIAISYPRNCFPMMGLHPCYVKEDFLRQLQQMKNELDAASFVAIGEIGLDLYWDKTFFEQQKEALVIQATWGIEKKLPIAIHSRNATKEAIQTLQPLVCEELTGVFHCFVGTVEEAREILDMGFYLGIGGVSTFKNGGLDQVLPHLPLDRIVLETDAPYLAPIPFRGKRNESAYIPYIAKKVAEIYQLPLEDVARTTTGNAQRLFKL